MVSPPPRLQPIPPANPVNGNLPPAPLNFQPFNFEGGNQNILPPAVPIPNQNLNNFRQAVEAAEPGPLMRQNAVMLGLDDVVPNAHN